LGAINAGYEDIYLSKYDASGNHQWTQQMGTPRNEDSHGVSADGQGNVFISGLSDGNLGGNAFGHYDAFLAKYSDPVIPEPSSLILAALAMVGLIGSGIQRRLIAG
jgi:hypothetical protein